MTADVIDLATHQARRDLAALTEKPSEVLPYPADLHGAVYYDTETTGLYCDDGDRVCAVGVAYRLKADPHWIHHHSFAFDQGRAEEKGFRVQYYPDTPAYAKKGLAGKPKGDPDGRWDWDSDKYNLPHSEWVTLCRWLQEAGQAVGLGNQNIRFDLHMLRAGVRARPGEAPWEGVELERYVRWDTMLATPEVWPKLGGTSLKPTAAALWGDDAIAEADVLKDALVETKKRYALTAAVGPRYDLVPWEINGPYAAADGVLALRLGELQEELLYQGIGRLDRVVAAFDLMRVLYRIERRGLGPLDMTEATRCAEVLEGRIEQLLESMPFSPVTGPRAATWFFDELGLAPWKNGEERRVVETVHEPDKKTGELIPKRKIRKQGTLDMFVTDRLAASGAEGAAEFGEYLRLRTANQMHYRGYVELASPADQRLRTSFRQAHVKSGRMSVERFQAQALPKKLGLTVDGAPVTEPRKLFLVAPGRTRINIDLSQAELRIAAKLAHCDKMIGMLETGSDFHGNTTRAVFGVDTDHPEWNLLRDIGKRLTFGSIFMIGPRKFQTTLWTLARIDWSLGQCTTAVQAWRREYPEFEAAYVGWLEHFEQEGWVPLIDGSRSYLGPLDYPNTAWNRIVQGSLAVFVRDWLIAVEKETARWDALVMTIHDSVVLDLPDVVVEEATARIVRLTAGMWAERFGIAGGCDVGKFDK